MLPLRRAGPSLARVLRKTGPSTKLYTTTAVPLSEPLVEVQSKRFEAEPQSVQISSLDNGLKVASLDRHTPIARVGLFFEAGSRYETQDNLGITHFLRSAAFISTENRTAFRIARESEQQGTRLEAICTRDHLIVASDCLCGNIGSAIESLADAASSPAFKPWELEEVGKRIRLDIAIAGTQPQISVLEELHRVAYRKNLGNSIYCLPHRINSITTNSLLDFSTRFFVGNGMALVGVGVDHEQLVELAKGAFSSLQAGSEPVKDKAKYHGGEAVHHHSSSLVHAAMVVEGASLGSKDLLTMGLLQRVMGTTPYIKWGSNMASSRLNKAASEVADGPFSVSALNVSYSDSGLFGCYVIAQPSSVGKVLKASIGQFANVGKGEISDEEITRAKNQLNASLLMNCESQHTNFEDIGAQALLTGSYIPASDVVHMVDSISKNDVLAVAKRVMSGKPCLAAAGDITNVPHVDELF